MLSVLIALPCPRRFFFFCCCWQISDFDGLQAMLDTVPSESSLLATGLSQLQSAKFDVEKRILLEGLVILFARANRPEGAPPPPGESMRGDSQR